MHLVRMGLKLQNQCTRPIWMPWPCSYAISIMVELEMIRAKNNELCYSETGRTPGQDNSILHEPIVPKTFVIFGRITRGQLDNKCCWSTSLVHNCTHTIIFSI